MATDPKIVYMDMDGVMCNFVGGVCKNIGVLDPFRDGFCEWDFINHHPDFAKYDSWGDLPGIDREFWANLEWMPDGREILELVENRFGRENIFLLSAPWPFHGGCMDGKEDWIKKHVPQYRNQFLFGTGKDGCAGPGRVLVDDRDNNVTAFAARGGDGILVPRPWNAYKDRDTLPFLREAFG